MKHAKISITLVSLLCWFSLFSSAQADGSAPPLQVQQIDPQFDVQKMAAPGVKVHTREEMSGKNWKLPSIQVRDHSFYEAGLRPFVAKWDQLDKDHLFIVAREVSPDKLVARYSKLPKENLLALSKLAKATDQTQ